MARPPQPETKPVMRAILVRAFGEPETMVVEELPLPAPGPGEALVRVEIAGVNFYDTQLRGGLFKRELPLPLGNEGAGTIAALGPDSTGFALGDRVGWAQSPGAYASHAIVPVERLISLPPAVGFAEAAATLFQGMTAHHLACSTYPLGPGDACFVHSAAGGVGWLLCQIAKLRGARVVGAVSSDEKAAVAREAGADLVLIYGRDDLVAETRRFTGGAGVSVVYDAVGKDTFETSLQSLRPRGVLAVYGEASGFVPPFDVRRLAALGSLYVTRTSLSTYVATREEYVARADDLLGWIAAGTLRPRIYATFPLAEAAQAHRALQSRATTGKVLLQCA